MNQGVVRRLLSKEGPSKWHNCGDNPLYPLGEWSNWVMDIKEDTWYDEHWVLRATDEALNSTSETIAQYMLIKLNLTTVF